MFGPLDWTNPRGNRMHFIARTPIELNRVQKSQRDEMSTAKHDLLTGSRPQEAHLPDPDPKAEALFTSRRIPGNKGQRNQRN
jgi:hypothetical protein